MPENFLAWGFKQVPRNSVAQTRVSTKEVMFSPPSVCLLVGLYVCKQDLARNYRTD